MISTEMRTWGWALAASLAVHGALLWQARTSAADGGHGTPAPVVTRVRFNSSGSAPSALASVMEPARPRTEPRTAPPKPREAASLPESSKSPSSQTETAAAAAPTGSISSTAAAAGSASPAELRQRYRGELLAHIERRKFYPDVARRRGVTGGVRVEFIVGPGGNITGLECGAGPAILNEAACEAVRRSLPLPEPPSDLPFPVSVSFVMDFALKQ